MNVCTVHPKEWLLLRGCCRGEVAVVGRFKQKSMYGLSAKKVAVVERSKQKSMYGLSAKKVVVVERWPL